MAIHIRGMIFNGRLRHGDRVRQDQLAEELGVSRIPVREAIIALAGEGWLSVTPHRGAYVHGLDPDTVRDHYELVGLVYGMAARRATKRATEDGLARLAEAQVALANAQSPTEVHDTNDVYLRRLNELAKAPRLASVMRGMSSVVPGNFFELVSRAPSRRRSSPPRRWCGPSARAMARRPPTSVSSSCAAKVSAWSSSWSRAACSHSTAAGARRRLTLRSARDHELPTATTPAAFGRPSAGSRPVPRCRRPARARVVAGRRSRRPTRRCRPRAARAPA